jgi:hypothetical protein
MTVERLAFSLFILGIGFLSYLYGVASARFGLFPYEFMHDAWIGGTALRQVWANSFDKQPPGALSFEAEPGIVPNSVRHEGGALPDRDLILITGGPYELMSVCPEFGCLAWIMDRAGTIYHAWPVGRNEPWGHIAQARGFSQFDDVYPESLHVNDNGDLLVSYQVRDGFPYSVGLAKFDKDGKLLWKHETFSHHWFYVDENGMIYAPSHEIVDSPVAIPGTSQQLVCNEKRIYKDLILVLSPDGTITRRISVLEALFESDYGGLVHLTPDACDPLHLNDVRLLTEEDAPAYTELLGGDMLISFRNLNTIAVLDPATARIKWISSGLTLRQHAPRYLGDNSILVFDNLGGPVDKGGSRIVKIDLASREVSTIFPRADTPPELNFFTEIAGHMDLNANRSRALVSLTMQGRVLEIDLQTGEVLWEYDHVDDVTKYMESAGQDEGKRYARFGINGAYYVEGASFLADAMQQRAAR